METEPIDEGQRMIALGTLRLAEARARAAVARTLIRVLRHHTHRITAFDAHDFAYAVWAEFVGDGGRDSTPLELQAGVFAQVAPFLDEETIFRIARDTWGDRGFEAADGADRVVWMPDDDAVIVTTGHLHPDGTTGQIDLIVSPMGVSGWTR